MDKENVVYVCVCVYMHAYIHTMEYDSVILFIYLFFDSVI